MYISPSHPRAASLKIREQLVWGVKKGIVHLSGLTAHGRGEAFDYLIGEKTQDFAKKGIEGAAALLLLSEYPVVCLNGNTAILVPKETITLADLLGAKIEVNLFHPGKRRQEKIIAHFKKYGAKEILPPDKARISGIKSNRRMVSSEGETRADVVFVPLEDGDRTERLLAIGKKVITVDLNPLSRTAQKATVTIVDNIVRAMPLLVEKVASLKGSSSARLLAIIKEYDNQAILSQALLFISKRLTEKI